MPKCIEALEELNGLSLSPLMLKKQPDIVTTIRKLRKYVGPSSNDEEGERVAIPNAREDAEKIRIKAEQVR